MSADKATTSLTPPGSVGISPHTFTKIEKNLAFLGFFSPSSKLSKKHKSKRVVFERTSNGKRIEVSATIIPGALYGLPLTADQDKFLALQKIINDVQRREGVLTNPVSFSSADILKLTRHKKNGNRYREIRDWLFLLDSVQIVSAGVVWLSGKKKWAEQSLRLFSRVVALGEELDSGKIADKYYVWLSDWLLENLRNTYLLPVDLDTYHRLNTNLAKVLVPLLQVRMYASRRAGRFEIRYQKLCQLLGTAQCRYLSDIKKQLVPSLNELTNHGYLSSWQIVRTQDRTDHKIVFKHGTTFLQDPGPREAATAVDDSDAVLPAVADLDRELAGNERNAPLLQALEQRGVAAAEAAKLLHRVGQHQDVARQIEFVDQLLRKAPRNKIWNAPGLYVYYIKNNITPSPQFQSRRQRQAQAETQLDERPVLLAYFCTYKPSQAQQYARSHPEDFRQLVEAEARATGMEESVASRNVRRRLAGLGEGNDRFPLLSFEDFRNRWETSEEFQRLYPAPAAPSPVA